MRRWRSRTIQRCRLSLDQGVSPVLSRLVKGTFWSLFGTIIARGLSVVSAIVVARMLGKEGFGEFGIIQSTLLNLTVFTSHGLGLTAIKYISELKGKDPERAGRIMTLSSVVASGAGVFLALLISLTAPFFASKLLSAPHLGGMLRIGAIMLLFTSMNGAQNGVLAGFEAFRTIARVNLYAGLLNFPLMAGGVWLWGLEGALWGMAVSGAAGWLITHCAVRAEAARWKVPFAMTGILRELPVLRGFSLPALLSSLVYGPVGWACSVMLVNSTNGYSEMAVFNATNQWFALIMFLPAQLSQVVLPMLSEAMGTDDSARSRQILATAARTYTAVVVPLVLGVSLLSPWLMTLYGEGYRSAWPVFVVSVVTAGLVAVQSPWAEVLNAGNNQWTMFMLNLIWAVVSLGLTPVLLGWGALGLVMARLLAFAVKGAATIYCSSIFARRNVAGSREILSANGAAP